MQWINVTFVLKGMRDEIFLLLLLLLLLLLTRTSYMYITNIIHDINNYTLEGLYTNTDFYKNIKAFTNFHRFNGLLFHRKSYSINILIYIYICFLPKRKKTHLHLWIWNFVCKKKKDLSCNAWIRIVRLFTFWFEWKQRIHVLLMTENSVRTLCPSDALQNGVTLTQRDREETNCWINVIFIFFAYKKYSRRFIKFRLNHW